MLIRTAQWMGLHRDGETFGLSPLDCEVRRRLWYQVIGSDARVAEDHGLSTSGFGGFCDTKLPLNVDDRDLSPEMETAPASKLRWTEMTIFLVTAEMNQALQQVSRLSVTVRNGNEKMLSLEQLLESIKSRINDKYLRHCDPNIPVQRSALLLGRVLMGKLEILVRQQYLRGLSAEESAARATENTLSLACDTIEIGDELKTNELLSNFHWLFSTYTQYHLLKYALWHLCARPGDHGADRAWEVVDTSFSLVENPSWPSPGLKWNVLRKLREKALDIWYAFAQPPNVRSDSTAPDTTGVLLDDSSILTLGDGMAWDLDSTCFPNLGPSDFWYTG